MNWQNPPDTPGSIAMMHFSSTRPIRAILLKRNHQVGIALIIQVLTLDQCNQLLDKRLLDYCRSRPIALIDMLLCEFRTLFYSSYLF